MCNSLIPVTISQLLTISNDQHFNFFASLPMCLVYLNFVLSHTSHYSRHTAESSGTADLILRLCDIIIYPIPTLQAGTVKEIERGL